MRKFALMLAAALAVSAPLAATMTTDSYAAAKKAKKAAAKKEVAKKESGPEVPFGTIVRAIDDLGHQLFAYSGPGGDEKVAKRHGKKKSASKKKAKRAKKA
jgi:hypothetical protein